MGILKKKKSDWYFVGIEKMVLRMLYHHLKINKQFLIMIFALYIIQFTFVLVEHPPGSDQTNSHEGTAWPRHWVVVSHEFATNLEKGIRIIHYKISLADLKDILI